ncbi:WD repeat-containing protein 62 isoform X2 [Festucalex cinctus]
MAELTDCGGSFHAAKRKSAAGKTSRHKTSVKLEKVLGISTASSSALASDPNSGLVAYPAGCVVVLLQPQINTQSHIVNTSRKPFSALAFSCDGKHLVTGESGHLPCVRVWQVDEGVEVGSVQKHKCSVSCVAFSPSGAYVVSVGSQYDMTVCVWDWKKGSVLASNKVSSSVSAISFSQDGGYFVTAGKRHVKFWYLDASKEQQVSSNMTVPLIGRSGVLGEQHKRVFSGVACGRGPAAKATFAVTQSALLCRFDASRRLDAWVPLKASCAHSLALSDHLVFCGCADGLVRVFSPSDLRYITTLPRPHRLGAELIMPRPFSPRLGHHYPDVGAMTFNPRLHHLTCVYSDHSVYVWDVEHLEKVTKIHSALYHSASVWNVQVCPQPSPARPVPSWFLTCSSDNTIRLWRVHSDAANNNIDSNDLLRILYVGDDRQAEQGDKSDADGKSWVRALALSPDGRQLATGDVCGTLRIFDLESLDELVKMEAHDAEILALEFSPPSTGVRLLASAGRDRLVRIFNLDRNFGLAQTVADHSASALAVKFAGDAEHVRLASCGADRSVYFYQRTEAADGSVHFVRTAQALEKTSLSDMDGDTSRTHVAVACQDRIVRLYNVETGKLSKSLKDSSTEGALLKVHVDPSGSYVATSCSNKNISILDYQSGERVASLSGHSELVTCLRFSEDCQHLISTSADSCVFVWRLDPRMTATMTRKKAADLRLLTSHASVTHWAETIPFSRETFLVGPACQLPGAKLPWVATCTPSRPDPEGPPPILTNGKMPMWYRRLGEPTTSSYVQSDAEPAPVRNRWLENSPLIILDYSLSSSKTDEDEDGEDKDEDFIPQSLEHLLRDEQDEEVERSFRDHLAQDRTCSAGTQSAAGDGSWSGFLHRHDDSSADLRPQNDAICVRDSKLAIQAAHQPPCFHQVDSGERGAARQRTNQPSPDSACSTGSAGSFDDDDMDSVTRGISAASSLVDQEETTYSASSEENLDWSSPQFQDLHLHPRLSVCRDFLSRFRHRLRDRTSQATPPMSICASVLEESHSTVNCERLPPC